MSVVPDFRDTAPGAASPHPAPGPPAAWALSPLTAWTLPLCLSSLLMPGSEVGVNGVFRHPLTWQGGRGDPRGVPRVLVAVTGRRARTGLAPSGVRLCGSPLGKVGESQSSPLPRGVQSQEGGTEVGGDTEHPEAVAVGGRSRPLSGRVGPGVWGAGGAACGWPGGEPPLRSAPTRWAGSFGTEPRRCPKKEVWALF